MSARGWLLAAAGAALALGLAGYGIWSRQGDHAALQARADETALPRVQAVAPRRGPPEQSLTLPGEVAAWNEAQIYGQVSGYVKQWFKDYGAEVAAGTVLATIETPTLDAQFEASKAKLGVAQARFNIAKLTSDRFTALTGTSAVTQQTIDDKNAETEARKAEVLAAQQEVDNYQARIDFKQLRAPFAGIVVARRVNIGDFIDGSGADAQQRTGAQAPFTVDDVHKLRVFVSVPQVYADVLKPGLKAELTLLGDAPRKVPATFLTQAGGVNRATRTVVAEFVVDGQPDGLMPGAYVDVTMTFPSDPAVLVVPSQALLFRAEGMQVAVIGEGDKVRLRKVTLGRDLGLDVQVTAGLDPADRIVASPSLGLLEGQQVKLVEPAAGYRPGGGEAKR